MLISLIAAVSENNVIGRNCDLPWHLPDDLKHFMATTKGHPVIMGRKTFDSIGMALPGRANFVISRKPNSLPKTVQKAASVEHAIRLAQNNSNTPSHVFIVGGGEIYRSSFCRADQIILTRVHAEIEGDTYFPTIDETSWREYDRAEHPSDELHEYSYSIIRYKRVISSQKPVGPNEANPRRQNKTSVTSCKHNCFTSTHTL